MPVAASLARALSPKPPDAQPQAAASAEVQQEGEGQGSSVATCRICWCGESITVVENAENAADSRSNNNHANDASGRLVAPCSCKGTCEFVHLGCLKSWLVASARAGKPAHSRARCELCGSKWRRGVYQALNSLPRGGGGGRISLGGGSGRGFRAAAVDAGSLFSSAARGCVAVLARTARRARTHPPDAALTLYAATLAVRGLGAAARGARRGAVVGGRVGRVSVGHATGYLEALPGVVLAGLCMPGFRLSDTLRVVALTAGAELALPVVAGVTLGAVAGAASGVAGDLRRHAAAAGGAALRLVLSLPPSPSSPSSPSSSSETSSSRQQQQQQQHGGGMGFRARASLLLPRAAAAPAQPQPRRSRSSSSSLLPPSLPTNTDAAAIAAAAPATASASSLSSLSPLTSPPLTAIDPRRGARGSGVGVGFRVWEERREAPGWLASLAMAVDGVVAAQRGRAPSF